MTDSDLSPPGSPRRRPMWLWGGAGAAALASLGAFFFFFEEARPPQRAAPPAAAGIAPGGPGQGGLPLDHPPLGGRAEGPPQATMPPDHPPVERGQAGPAPSHPSVGQGAARRVAIPPAVEGRWAAVRLRVAPKAAGAEPRTVVVALGQEAPIPGTGLTARAVAFLPALQIQGDLITSTSNEPENPAAQVTIREGGKEVFAGWFFARYPDMQGFDHPTVRITLVEGIPKGAAGGGT